MDCDTDCNLDCYLEYITMYKDFLAHASHNGNSVQDRSVATALAVCDASRI